MGTTHADYFCGAIPCTGRARRAQTRGDYERETGLAIVAALPAKGAIDPLQMPAVLVANHGPFVWGPDAEAAVHNAAVLELTARMAFLTLQLNPGCPPCRTHLLEKHFSPQARPGRLLRADAGRRAAPAPP